MPNIQIIGGGTISHIRNHLALCVPAYGTTARTLYTLCGLDPRCVRGEYAYALHLTRMANSGEPYDEPSTLETNQDVSQLVDTWIADPETRIVFFNVALVDYQGSILENGPTGYEWSDDLTTSSWKYAPRLETSRGQVKMLLTPTDKILGRIRRKRKDIFLVAFKTTCGANPDEQFLTGLHLLKSNSCNLVLANDTRTRYNMIITPEQARYYSTTNREEVLRGLVKMTLDRAQGTFTRSTVIPGDPVPWDKEIIPQSLKAVVEHCIEHGAYKPFNGSTVGHFAFKKSQTDFITSKRGSNFNKLAKVGMVLCQSSGPDQVVAHGAKPSVGGQSQRIIFQEHPDMDCIVHFHVPPKDKNKLSVRSQEPYECGSHQCGQNTSQGLREEVPGIKCVYLDNHGPNIVFHHKINPDQVIEFIDQNFDLSQSTDQIDRNQVVVP